MVTKEDFNLQSGIATRSISRVFESKVWLTALNLDFFNSQSLRWLPRYHQLKSIRRVRWDNSIVCNAICGLKLNQDATKPATSPWKHSLVGSWLGLAANSMSGHWQSDVLLIFNLYISQRKNTTCLRHIFQGLIICIYVLTGNLHSSPHNLHRKSQPMQVSFSMLPAGGVVVTSKPFEE